jgi:hypothetical protein
VATGLRFEVTKFHEIYSMPTIIHEASAREVFRIAEKMARRTVGWNL